MLNGVLESKREKFLHRIHTTMFSVRGSLILRLKCVCPYYLTTCVHGQKVVDWSLGLSLKVIVEE